MIAEAVELAGIGQFANVEDAVNVAAMALNYIMLQIKEEPEAIEDDE
jgi:hypothetical protein